MILEYRAEDTSDKVEKLAEKNKKVFVDLLSTQQEAVFDVLKSDMKGDVSKAIDKTSTLWKDALNKMYLQSALELGKHPVVEKRSTESDLTDSISEYFRKEAIILTEISMINETTVDKIIANVASALESGASIGELQQSLIDCGVFSEKRALMLARTISGTAANIGQINGAVQAGAKTKTWMTAGFEVRKDHQKMDGVTIPIDEYFIVGGEKAMFPLDNRLSPKERVNCRCTMTFGIEG